MHLSPTSKLGYLSFKRIQTFHKGLSESQTKESFVHLKMSSVIRKMLSIQHPLCERHFWNNTEKLLQIRTLFSIFSLIHMSCH